MRISNRTASRTLLAFSVLMCACNGTQSEKHEKEYFKTTEEQKSLSMNSFVAIFEIPANDISRAVNFYQTILGIEIETMEFPGTEMGIFPYENQVTTGVIIKAEGYEPSTKGPIIYLNGGDNLQNVLDKVLDNGGEVIVPKTAHMDESGFFALFLDSEGNKMGLHSNH